MAIITNGPNGNLSGRVGGNVYRNFGNKTVVASAPGSYSKPKDEASAERFASFALVSYFARFTGKFSDSELKPLWKNSDVKGPGAYHKFKKVNYGKINSLYQFHDFHLLPPSSEFKITADVTMEEEIISVKIQPLGAESKVDPERELYLKLHGFLLFNQPLYLNTAKHTNEPFTSDFMKVVPGQQYDFNFDLSLVNNGVGMKEMNRRTFIGAIVTYNSEYKPVKWSETIIEVHVLNPDYTGRIQYVHEEEE